MKKLLVLMGLVLIVMTLAACVSDNGNGQDAVADPQGSDRVYVFNWGDFIYEPVLRMFEEEYGIRVIYSMYGSNEEMYERVVGGGARFDVIIPSDYMIQRMIYEGRLARINWDNIPNMQYIDPKFWDWAHDPDNLYSVPYMWGTFGIVYNTTMVDQPVYSWDILWDPQFENNIFMYDSSRCTMGVALRYLGFSLNSTNIDEINAARDLLISQGSIVRAFVQDQVMPFMIGEEAAIAPAYSGDARWIIYYNDNHNFVNPVEGVQLFIDSMIIPTNARCQINAEKFINFMTRPDIAYLNTRFIRYSTTNAGAFAKLPEYWQNCPIYWPDLDYFSGERGEVLLDLGDFRAELERAWTQVLASHMR